MVSNAVPVIIPEQQPLLFPILKTEKIRINPGGENPDNPGGEDPDNPGGEDPDNPGGEDPDNPGGEEPDNPGSEDPGQDQAWRPADIRQTWLCGMLQIIPYLWETQLWIPGSHCGR